MNDERKRATFVAAMKAHFGMKPGQTLAEFGAELRAIKPHRAEFVDMLGTVGYDISDPTVQEQAQPTAV